MPSHTFKITSERDIENMLVNVRGRKMPFRVTVEDGKESRTKQQNKLLHKWFGEIAAQRGDTTMLDVKAECNLEYGFPILSRDDPEWEVVFGFIFRGLDHERKIKAIRKLDVPFTRGMKLKQLIEYMDQMQIDYRADGFHLTDPQLRKYEGDKDE